jgi:hypothetical protein
MRKASPLLLFLLSVLIILLIVNFGPSERTLGKNVRLVYLHGAWVWTALIGFLLASAAGLAGLALRRDTFQRISVAAGQVAALFWLAYLPLSLWTMQANWGGMYLLEPRWRVAVNFAVIAALIQAAIVILKDPAVGSILNIAYTGLLSWSLSHTEQVMHPPSPIFSSGSLAIRSFFLVLTALCLIAAWQLARYFLRRVPQSE